MYVKDINLLLVKYVASIHKYTLVVYIWILFNIFDLKMNLHMA